jgi:SAM-dependent methyltransferase
MAFFFHQDRELYFQHQQANTAAHVLPFIESILPVSPGTQVMEVGCGEGGVLKAFLDRGCIGTGVELDQPKAEMAGHFLREEIAAGKAVILHKNIYDVDFSEAYANRFQLIILKDVIEHIFDQQKLIAQLRGYLQPGGYIYFGFPPWYMPFGGHQQVCSSKFLNKLPWVHLLPNFLYKAVMRWFGEREGTIQYMLETKETGISIERFERIVKKTGYTIVHEQHYLINPIYEWKFGLKAKLQFRWINKLPFIRNFLTTCSYYLVKA